jgi:hypothetical protein
MLLHSVLRGLMINIQLASKYYLGLILSTVNFSSRFCACCEFIVLCSALYLSYLAS